jgi:hypothetical protein
MTDPELQTAYDEVLRKIGRNLIMFQKAEYCIKGLVAMGSFRLAPSDGPKTFKDVIEGMKETMGGLKNQLFEKHYYAVEEPKPPIKESTDPDEVSVQTTFTRQLPDLGLRRAAIDNMVAERNKLVHNLLPELEPRSLDSCAAVALMLDRQRKKFLPELEWLQDQFQETHEQIMEMLDFINSEEGKELMRTSEIQQSPAISKLASLAGATTDPEGWISVRDAYLQLNEDEQSDITRLRKYYNLTSLSSFIAASRMFEVRSERSGNRPGRYLFRLMRSAAVST